MPLFDLGNEKETPTLFVTKNNFSLTLIGKVCRMEKYKYIISIQNDKVW